jgi:hypothetical protein
MNVKTKSVCIWSKNVKQERVALNGSFDRISIPCKNKQTITDEKLTIYLFIS